MELTLSQLACFVASLESGSFTAAAAELDISQPAVAEQVQRLERAVGQSLFARRARGVAPTPAGNELAPHARRVLDAARAATQAMSTSAGTAGPVALGTFGAPHHYGLTTLVQSFLGDHPDARLRVVGHNSSSTATAVRTGELDAGVVTLPVDDSGLDVQPLFDSEVLYVSSHPLHTRRPPTIHDLATRSLILYEASAGTEDPTRYQLAARAQSAGVQLRPRIEVETAEAALELAAHGLGDTYAPQVLRRNLDPRLKACSFEPPLVDTIAMITRRGSRLSPSMQDLADRLTRHLLALMEARG